MTTYTITEADLTTCLNQRLPDVAHTLLSSLTPNSGKMAAPSYELPFIPWSKEAEMMEAWAAPSTSQKCEWTFSDDDSGTWASSCKELWSFIDGGPKENRVSYCHHCGHPVTIKGGA